MAHAHTVTILASPQQTDIHIHMLQRPVKSPSSCYLKTSDAGKRPYGGAVSGVLIAKNGTSLFGI